MNKLNLQKTLVVLVVSIVMAMLPSLSIRAETSSVNVDQLSKTIGERILKQWQCTGDGKIQLELKFQLTNEGDVYHLDLSKGFDDPFAIRAAIHAVLFAMPYPSLSGVDGSMVTCAISGDRKSPSVQVEFAKYESKNLTTELSKLPAVDKYVHQTFLYGPAALRLSGLCECLFDFPGSAEILGEIQKICPHIGLDTKTPHDWVGIGRSADKTIVIMRNPSQDAQKELRGAIAAYLESWRLKHDTPVLYELEDAWTRYAAMKVLAVSKANPLLLGNAAVLTNQFKTAKEQYELAVKDGSTEASSILSQLKSLDYSSELRPIELKSTFVPKRDSNAWEALLNWIPVDTELVIFDTKSSKDPVADGQEQMSLFGDLILPTAKRDPNKPTLVEERQKKTNSIFAEVANVSCFHAARTFKVPKGGFIGIGFSDCADIMVLPEVSKTVSQKVIEQLRPQCERRQAVEGVEVLCFDKTPWSFGLSGFGDKKFVCTPYEGIIIASTDLGYLREVLLRLRSQPNDRALPAENPEWKLVDTTAKTWAVRHFDKSYVPFDNTGMYDIVTTKFADRKNPEEVTEDVGQEIGFTFSKKDSILTIHQLSTNPKTLAGLAKTWPMVFNYDGMSAPKEVTSGNPKVTLNKNVLTVEGTVLQRSMVWMQLLIALGYFVAI